MRWEHTARRLLAAIALTVFAIATCLWPPTLRADDDFEQIVVSSTSIGFTVTKITPARGDQMIVARCRLRTAEISFTTDGTTPTTTIGTLLEVGDVLKVTTHDRLVKFRAIRTTGSDGQLDCAFSGALD